MKRIYVSIFGLLVASALHAEMSTIDEQTVRLAVQNACQQQSEILDQLKMYIEHAKLAGKKDIIYQLNLLKACVSDDVRRAGSCSVSELDAMLRAAEFVVENFNKNIPSNLEQICTSQPIVPVTEEQKSVTAADLFARYQQLQASMQLLLNKLAELNMTALDKLLDRADKFYGAQKTWLEPAIAATILGACFWKSEEIKTFVNSHKLGCSVAGALIYFLRAQRRATIAALKDKLPAAVYYPLALCKWCVGAQEKAVRMNIPYGTDIAEAKKWIGEQEKKHGVKIEFDEPKSFPPFGLGSLNTVSGIKVEMPAPLSFQFGPDGLTGGLFFYPFGSNKK